MIKEYFWASYKKSEDWVMGSYDNGNGSVEISDGNMQSILGFI